MKHLPRKITAPMGHYNLSHATDVYQIDRVMEELDGEFTFVVLYWVEDQGWLQAVFVEHTWNMVRAEVKGYFQFSNSTIILSIFGGVVFDARMGPSGEEIDD